MKKYIIINFLLSLILNPAHADYIGNVGAVNQTASGAEPKGNMHPLLLGNKIENNERIQTGADGTVQIVFLDTSTMTVGRNTTITIDKFIYSNNNQDSTTQNLSLARGVLRFIGGAVSHTNGAVIKTPTASIGIRGGSALISINSDNTTTVVLHYGVLAVSTNSDEKTISRPGLGINISPEGKISEIFRVSSASLSTINQGLTSSGRQSGGARNPPKNTDVNEALANLPTLNVIQGNGLNQIGQMWAGNALVQSFANAVNQYNTATQVDTLSQIQAGQVNPHPGPGPGPGPGPTPPPVPPVPPTPPTPPNPPNPPGPANF